MTRWTEARADAGQAWYQSRISVPSSMSNRANSTHPAPTSNLDIQPDAAERPAAQLRCGALPRLQTVTDAPKLEVSRREEFRQVVGRGFLDVSPEVLEHGRAQICSVDGGTCGADRPGEQQRPGGQNARRGAMIKRALTLSAPSWRRQAPRPDRTCRRHGQPKRPSRPRFLRPAAERAPRQGCDSRVCRRAARLGIFTEVPQAAPCCLLAGDHAPVDRSTSTPG